MFNITFSRKIRCSVPIVAHKIQKIKNSAPTVAETSREIMQQEQSSQTTSAADKEIQALLNPRKNFLINFIYSATANWKNSE